MECVSSILFWTSLGDGYHIRYDGTDLLQLKVYTAYEYLETRFDLKTRSLAALFFLILRGLSVGITLFAPSLVLSTILGWSITFTTIIIGSFVIIYVVTGGTKAVSLTQRQQMTVIMSGMILAGILAFYMLPEGCFLW